MTGSNLPRDIVERSLRRGPVIAPHLVKTALEDFPALGEPADAQVLLKCEHRQVTGSFKARGALSKLWALGPQQRDAGVVTASSGNHGLGVAHALRSLGGTGVICVPTTASTVKVAAIRRMGVEVCKLGDDAGETEVLAQALAGDRGAAYVSPYDDLDVIAGQGTIGTELITQAGGAGLDAVVVAVGGGGLVSGVAAVLKDRFPDLLVIGASPLNDAAMAASVEAGTVVAPPAHPTLSDGTAGAVMPGAITLDLCRDLVDAWVLVSEEEIAAALRLVIDERHELIEGAAGVAVAAVARSRDLLSGRRVAVISCGAHIAADTLARALSQFPKPAK